MKEPDRRSSTAMISAPTSANWAMQIAVASRAAIDTPKWPAAQTTARAASVYQYQARSRLRYWLTVTLAKYPVAATIAMVAML
ncbi:hypothetical protein LUW74_07825 [Actinomadura madurae]|uniref:hypothetical protein n=1 Tax=Actinomadura madurae TaxID=1993 RepID=UPI002027577B|nr:hypothetical protein [Actinomadura madurae]URN03263.1 hypothetical protein LUW74_07825 [Actinomadura madurae]